MARKIITINVKTKACDPVATKCDLLAVGIFSDAPAGGQLVKQLDKKLAAAITKVKSLGDFKPTCGESAVVYGNNKIAPQRVLLVGLGEKKNFTPNCLRKAASLAATKAVDLNIKNLNLALTDSLGKKMDQQTAGQVLAEGAFFGAYRYDEYINAKDAKRPDKVSVTIVSDDSAAIKLMAKGVKTGTVTGQAQCFARTIANRPGNIVNPAAMAAEAKKIAKESSNLTCKVLNEKQLEDIGAGGILAVGQGSSSGSKLIVLKYTPAKKSNKTIGFVGKAVTFDSGGISIKPSAGMHEMKFDKSGGVAVLGAMKAIAGLKPNVNVYGIIPAAENMPDGSSIRPGDIVTTLSGKTVEIQNTDAEGRMILCDGIEYAIRQKCDTIIDIATLTGACVVALGKYMAGVMSSDDKLVKQIQTASEETGDRVWHLPCGDDYTKELKSEVADLKNIGSRWGGASTAASFLKEFAGKTTWAHIDMAGVEIFTGKNLGAPGSPGYGVKLLAAIAVNAGKK